MRECGRVSTSERTPSNSRVPPLRSPQARFGARVRALRLAAQMTQDDLAERCGLFRTYMSRIETGQANPTLTMIHALADSLGVEVTALFGDPNEVNLVKRVRTAAGRSRGRASG